MAFNPEKPYEVTVRQRLWFLPVGPRIRLISSESEPGRADYTVPNSDPNGIGAESYTFDVDVKAGTVTRIRNFTEWSHVDKQTTLTEHGSRRTASIEMPVTVGPLADNLHVVISNT